MVDISKTTNSTSLYEAAIGERNQAYYLDKFEHFDDAGDGFHASWNWAAYFFTGFWALYRKMYGWFFATFAFVIILNIAMKLNPAPAVGLLYLVPGFCFAIFGNSLYHRKVKAQIANAQESNNDDRKVIKRLNASSGVHRWALYIFGPISVIGIVAATAIPTYQNKSKFDASTAKPMTEAQTTEKSSDLKPFTGKLDSEPVNPFAQFHEKPNQSSANASLSFNYEDAKYEEAIALLKQRDYANALKILNPLAAQGDARAQKSLGGLYSLGGGVSKNFVESAKWYRLSANQGNSDAQAQHGMQYAAGEGVLQDYTEAVKWYRLAAVQGNVLAQNQLGLAYIMGSGIAQDAVRAHMWLNLSATSGEPAVMKNRDEVAKDMSPQQIALAQQMARECQQRNFKDC